MSVKFLCAHCGHKLKAYADQAGKTCKCTRCGKSMAIPAASFGRDGLAAPPGEAPGAMSPPPLPVAQPRANRRLLLGGLVAAAVLVGAALVVAIVLIVSANETTQKVNDLKSGGPKERAHALTWLAQADPQDADRAQVTAALEPLLSDNDPHRRLDHDLVLRVYLRWADKNNVPALIGLVENPPPGSWQPKDTGVVMATLGKFKDSRAVPVLAQKLLDPAVRDQAVYALKLIGPGAGRTVLNYVFDGDAPTRVAAGQVLADYGMPQSAVAAEALRRLASNQPDDQRVAAAWCAENAPDNPTQKAEGAVLLAKMLDNLSPKVDALALCALNLWATRDILPQLTAFALRQEKAASGLDAAACKPMLIDVLAQIPDKAAAEAIALQLKDAGQRAKAVQALLKLGPVATDAILAYVDSPDAAIQKEARSLARLLNVPADRLLEQTLTDMAGTSRPRTRIALEHLAKLRPDANNRVKVSWTLNAPLVDPDPAVRLAALDAAEAWVSRENTDALVRFLTDVPVGGKARDGRIVARISKLLISIGPAVEPKVIPLLKSTDIVVRSQACWILTEVGTPKSVEPLQEAARLYASVDFNFFNQTQFALQKITARK